MEDTLPPSCQNHGANIGSVRYARPPWGVRRHLAATASELNWALQLTGRITQVQNALTGPS
jgi:hypothetical protein